MMVCNINGQVVSNGVASAGNTTISLQPGIYIVKVGNEVKKVSIK